MLSLVCTGISDHLWRVYHPRIFQAIQVGHTQPSHPTMGRCNEYWKWLQPPLGKKRRLLHSSIPCDQDCWHSTGLSRLEALAVNLSQPSSRHGLYASFIRSWVWPSLPQRSYRGWTDFTIYAETSFSSSATTRANQLWSRHKNYNEIIYNTSQTHPKLIIHILLQLLAFLFHCQYLVFPLRWVAQWSVRHHTHVM